MISSTSSAYHAIISSDWNECLAPCGPFDSFVFSYPELQPQLDHVFRQYTANRITLPAAISQLAALLPAAISRAEMDRYLDQAFETYTGVPALIEWCARQHILFMINTTGMVGYFQRAMAKALLPQVPVLAAHRYLQYPPQASDPPLLLDLTDIPDKARHTQKVVNIHTIPMERVILIGDSGGDGPHFAWGADQGAYLIASMAKPSLTAYCHKAGINIDYHFGNIAADTRIDFRNLIPVIQQHLAR